MVCFQSVPLIIIFLSSVYLKKIPNLAYIYDFLYHIIAIDLVIFKLSIYKFPLAM